MRDYLELTKPRITLLILVCTAVGYSFGFQHPFRLLTFLQVLLGTALMASGTSALNQWYEADSDAKMCRTRDATHPRRTDETQSRICFCRAIVHGRLC